MLRYRIHAAPAALLLLTLIGCDHAARQVTAPASGDVAFSRSGAATPESGPAANTNRENLQRRTPLGFSEFFPLRAGNRWRYAISSTTDMSANSARFAMTWYRGDHIQEQTCTGDNGGVSYLAAFDSTHVVGDGYESSTWYWTLMRQNGSGLYEVDYALADPPCGTVEGAMRPALAPGARTQRDWERFSSEPAVAAQRAAWESAWQRHVAKLATVESIIFEGGPWRFDPQRPLRHPEDGELLVLAYPLEVGRQWIVRNRPDYRATVEAHEPVDVPAGHFKAYRLRMRSDLFPPDLKVWFWYGSQGLLKHHYEVSTLAVDSNNNIVGTFRSTYEEVLAELDLRSAPPE
jgi:hypothetical protein